MPKQSKKTDPVIHTSKLASEKQSGVLFLSDTVQDLEQELIDIKGDIKSINNDVVYFTKSIKQIEAELSMNWRRTISIDHTVAYLEKRKEQLEKRTWMLLGLHVVTILALLIITLYGKTL